jgi:GTP cyclohydrolase II
MVTKLVETTLKTAYGEFREILYYNGQKEAVALVMGDVNDQENVLCRVHSSCLNGHAFNSIECDCREQMAMAQRRIQEAGRGIIIWLDQEGKGNGFYALLQSIQHKRTGLTQADAYEAVGFQRDARDFAVAAAILKDLKINSIVMMTENPLKTKTLTQFGINVTNTI